MNILTIKHNAGFFSCCTVRLNSILNYFNENKNIPDLVDSSEQFNFYKSTNHDISKIIFKENNSNIIYEKKISITDTGYEDQFSDYSKLNFDAINPFLKKYFSLSDVVEFKINFLIKKYNLNLDEIISVYYRGNDKISETNIAPYHVFTDKIDETLKLNKNFKLLIQTDEIDFLNFCKKKYGENVIYFEEMNGINKNQSVGSHFFNTQKEEFLINFISAIKILSMSNTIITSSSNGGLWILLLRGNSKNVNQYLDPNLNIESSFLSSVKNNNLISPLKNNNWVIY